MPQMSRNTSPWGADNLTNPTAAQFQYYSKQYTTTGAQEWIYLPDGSIPIGITLSGSGVWSATIEATDSPPNVVNGTTSGTVSTYSWPAGVVSATNSFNLQGATAFRVNVTAAGTYVQLDARC